MAHLRGTVGDGALTIAARGTATSYKPDDAGGEVRHVHVQDAVFENAIDKTRGSGAIVHTWPHDEATIAHVRVRDVACRNLTRHPAIRLGGGDRTPTDASRHRDILIDGVQADGQPLCSVWNDVADLTIENARVRDFPTLFWTEGYTVDGLTLRNSLCEPRGRIEPVGRYETWIGTELGPGAIRLDGTLRNARIEDCTVRFAGTNGPRVAFCVDDAATVEDLVVEGLHVEGGTTGVEVGSKQVLGASSSIPSS
jgi:hypothetical protein